ncbi:hypothetical protein [Streptomyces rubiginosohelvolus]|uniref:Integral membrane protein n=1 Tax=Streptomyces rubiginosohelvolus TaxID=67362 RepID=A0ABQ3BF05_9ACTN|nr:MULTISPECIES: hypothetical protein [Streptomyces]GGR76766.1 hypothetical protein GCM10010284_07150 [Streptomyces rubiginosohelvolus]GGZ40520.1 hypothetical protein GCM10010328_13630 [Streptomyces pluricolorescens]
MEKSGRPEKKRLFGLSLLLSILVLLLEAMVALVVSVVYDITQESPNAGGGGSAMFILFLPVLAVFATAIAGTLSVVLVFPTAWLSGVLGRRFGGREVWWWVPVVAGAVSLVIVAAVVALAGGAGAGAVALGWFLTTAALTVPALLWRSRRKRVFGPVTLWGVAAVVLTAVLGGVGLATGVLEEYRPPAFTSADLVGRWSDGHGGTLTLTAYGRVTADAIDDNLGGWGHGDGEGDGAICTGQGTWTYEPGGGTWSQEVDITVDSCTYGTWNVGGTETRPTLYQYIGDPDSWDLYELRRTDGGP